MSAPKSKKTIIYYFVSITVPVFGHYNHVVHQFTILAGPGMENNMRFQENVVRCDLVVNRSVQIRCVYCLIVVP